MPYWSAHSHSKYSMKDALPTVADMVEIAAAHQYPALGLTDHGVIGGIHELYRHANAAGIMPVPGCEMYVALSRTTERPTTRHLGVLATTTAGWHNLIGLVNMSMRHFKYKPLVDIADLYTLKSQGLLEGLHVMTGCFFGLLVGSMYAEPRAAENVLHTLKDLFDGRVYVELQNHHITTEDHDDYTLANNLWLLAQRTGTPVVITNDSHYLVAADAPAHRTYKKLFSWNIDDPDSAVFPGDGYHLCSAAEMAARFSPMVYAEGVAGLDAIVSHYDLQVPELDRFIAQIPQVGSSDPQRDLERRTRVALNVSEKIPVTKVDAYTQRLDDELAVVKTTGFADYLLLVASITDWMREQGIVFNARGSASGSLLCWMLGITALDPLKYKLAFERFLSPDRVKLPDIDLDVQHDRRTEVIDRLHAMFPCARIGQYSRLSVSADEEENTGSLWVKWHQMNGHINDGMRREPGAKDIAKLEALSTYEAYGAISIHPAGILVAPDEATLAKVPMQYIANSETMVTALDMHNVEDAGYVKIDVLGVRTITAMAYTLAELGMDPDQIELTDRATYSRIRSGELDGVFQLSGYSASRGCTRLKPTKFDDVVAAMALFRPAAQKSGAVDEYMAVRQRKKTPVKHSPVIEHHVADTYGVLLYQEQLIGVLRDMGMDQLQLSGLLKAVKASNANTASAERYMAEVQGTVVRLAADNNLSEADVRWLLGAMNAYADYGFNRAHAVAYARVAYITAWLITHHSSLYWSHLLTAMMDSAKNIPALRRAAMRADGIRFLPPHVNTSRAGYTSVGPKRITSGLISIPGVGEKACAEIVRHAPYSSVHDLASRVNKQAITGSKAILAGAAPDETGTTVIHHLYTAGALDGLPLHDVDPDAPITGEGDTA